MVRSREANKGWRDLSSERDAEELDRPKPQRGLVRTDLPAGVLRAEPSPWGRAPIVPAPPHPGVAARRQRDRLGTLLQRLSGRLEEEEEEADSRANEEEEYVQDITALLTNPLLCTLRTPELVDLLKAGRWLDFDPDDVIIREATTCDAVLFLSVGRAKAEVRAGSQRVVVNLLGPGDAIGDLSLLDGAPHPTMVTALERVRSVSLAMPALRDLLKGHAEWYRVLAETAAGQARNTSAWLQSLIAD